jgi:xanthine dehydrogenase accessory factor
MSEFDAILGALNETPRESAALATLVRIEGSSYRRPGARMLALSGGRRVGPPMIWATSIHQTTTVNT